ncbi:MAG: hypothetical protein HZC54_11080 [Verrucomicrobia bacterium]|nr:hypothetical protein [Verrucomicrobiota bacterium]
MKSRQLLILIGTAVVLGAVWLMLGGASLFTTPKTEKLLMCGNADCANEFKAQLPVKFQDYPAKCPKCSQRSAFVLTRCWRCSAPYPLDLKHPLEKCPKCGCELPKY